MCACVRQWAARIVWALIINFLTPTTIAAGIGYLLFLNLLYALFPSFSATFVWKELCSWLGVPPPPALQLLGAFI